MTVEEITREIHDAFAGVTREGGVSWRGAQVLDFYGDEKYASFIDSDSQWTDLIDNSDWQPGPGIGGFSFLDPIGVRYYLPAAMIRSIQSGYDEGIQYHLTIPKKWRPFHDHSLQKFSRLNEAQKSCVRRFIEYMIEIAGAAEFVELERRPWQKALNSHWKQF